MTRITKDASGREIPPAQPVGRDYQTTQDEVQMPDRRKQRNWG